MLARSGFASLRLRLSALQHTSPFGLRLSARRLRRLVLLPCEQMLDRPHKKEEATVMTFGREDLEPVVFVEGLRILALGVGDDGEGSDSA